MTDCEAGPWEAVGPKLAWSVLFDARSGLERTLDDVEAALQAGDRPTAGQVDAIRRELEALQEFNEETLAALADGTEPWERGPGERVPHGVLRRCQGAVDEH